MQAVFRKAFYDSRRTILWLAIGLGLYVLFTMMYYPTLVDQAEEMNDLLRSYPESLMNMFYKGDLADFDLTNPGTYIETYMGSYGVMIIGVLVIAQAFGAITNAERNNTLDVMLSLPISRRAYLLGRMLHSLCVIMITLAVIFGLYAVSTVLWPEFDVRLDRLALGILDNLFPLAVVMMLSYMLAVLVPSSKHFAGPIAYTVLIGSYLIYGFISSIEQLADMRKLLLFHYYSPGSVIREGPNWGYWALLTAVALVYGGIAWWRIDKKELGV